MNSQQNKYLKSCSNAMKYIKSTLLMLAAALMLVQTMQTVQASENTYPLQSAPKKAADLSAVQDGAKTFVNYCLNCHSASALRFNQLKEIGLTEQQIKDNLLLSTEKIGDTMQVALKGEDAKKWFGANPPDLSLIARSRGTDWLYTYMRSFYVDPTRPTGWNNALFPNVGMPHILWEEQGINAAKIIEEKDIHDEKKVTHTIVGFENIKPGLLKPIDYDEKIANLVAFLDWMSEPNQNTRKRTGMWVLLYLGIFTILAWRLNVNFWKDIK